MNGIVTAAPTVAEAEALAADVRTRWPEVSRLPEDLRQLEGRLAAAEGQISGVRRSLAAQPAPTPPGAPHPVSHALARRVAASVVALCARDGRLELLSSVGSTCDALVAFAREELGLTTRSALTTSDIPLPSTYGAELGELVAKYGVARQRMTRYPIGLGTAKPARMGTRPAFGAISMSAPVTERSPALTFAALESHKLGGLVRLPREIDEQSIVPMGEFLTRYGATEFARSEDAWAFNADGSGTYDNVAGVVKTALDNSKVVTLATGKTKPSDITLADYRAVRALVNPAVLNGGDGAYYMDSSWDAFLGGLRTAGDPNVYVRLPDGTARLDGYPIVWTNVLAPYSTSAALSTALCVFGSLRHWWMGEHGYPRVDVSEHVYFANDQLAVRFLEEIDFDYMAVDATATVRTAAS